jgi:tetratricopeptide (TPR) repeat protein
MSVPASPEKLWNQATALHRTGRLDEAAAAYGQLLTLKPDFAEGHGNLGNVLAALGKHDDAVLAYRKALKIRRDYLEALLGLGNALKAQGHLEDAVAAYRSALSIKPEFPAALYNLGGVLRALGQREQAIAAFARAVAQQPDFFQARNNLGNLYFEEGQWQKAEETFSVIVAAQPLFEKGHNNLGMTLHKREKFAQAEASFCEAIRLKPDYIEAYDNLGALLLEMRRTDEAFRCFMRRALLAPASEPNLAIAHRLKHDQEQTEHRGSSSGRQIEIRGGERVAGPAINKRNSAEIGTAWQTRQPQLVIIDDLLTPAALDGLRRFCHESTIWQDVFEGYLGARPQSGFACPLLAQVAEELASAYPEIFEHHPLLFAWAFKYEQGMRGTKVHADFAAVNVNFWITPDEANEDPETGGLVVWDVAAPLDWDFTKYNADDAAIREFLTRNGAKTTRVPHRANRAVVFDSDLFHETDVMHFRPGYETRRINITLLYGTRAKNPIRSSNDA